MRAQFWSTQIATHPSFPADLSPIDAQANDGVKGCTNFHRGSYAIDAGDVIDGCLVFPVFNDLRIGTVEWGVG